tara:strand:+ start:10799 stop:11578 length:780 start_codon:yes stop_codon:yes gene_type:complete
MTFGHGSWDTFGASTAGGNQVFHGWFGDAWDNIKDTGRKVYSKYKPDERVDEVVLENPTCAANKRQLTIRVYRNNITTNKPGEDFAENELYQKAWIREWIEPTEATQSLDDAGNPMTDDEGIAIMDEGTEGSWKTLSRSESKSLKSIDAAARSELHPELVEWAKTNGWETGGCTDENATNYSEDASCDDGSCECSDGYEMNDDGICAEPVVATDDGTDGTITTQSTTTTTVAEPSKLPLIIGLGVLGVVAFTMMDKKEE